MTKRISRRLWAAGFGGLSFVLLAGLSASAQDVPASTVIRQGARHYGAFAAGGVGTGERSDFKFFNAGGQAGFVLTPNALPGWLHGNFEVGAEVIPLWASFTPHRLYTFKNKDGSTQTFAGGGTYWGVGLTPVILRWNLIHSEKRLVPWAQGAGGLLYTTKKYPLPATSVWNFEPQFGVGVHYFVNSRHSIDFAANAIHISNASLGDHNAGVNALVQFQLGYTWWKK